ncbi:MAG: hypothetical protein Q8P74_01340 [bacterium]|nr:hypothetical protein [bacterium]
MKILKKFLGLTLERKLVLFFVLLCIALPFIMAKTPMELVSRSMPLWINYGWATTWICDGKPVWEVALAVYGIITAEMLAVYFGLFLGRILLEKAGKIIKENLKKGLKLPFSENTLLLIEKRSGWKAVNVFAQKEKKRLSERLNKGSIIIIFLFLLAPVPLTDLIAVTALAARKLKYGHWYLAAVNLPHTYLLIYFGKLVMDWINSIF